MSQSANGNGQILGLGCVAEFTYFHPDGTLGWKAQAHNSVTIGGRHWLMFRTFRAQSSFPCTRIGLISATGYTGTSVDDTFDQHPGWIEFTGYSNNGFRPDSSYTPASSGQIATLAPINFSINAQGSLRGAFMSNSSLLTDTGSNFILYNTIPLTSNFPVSQGGSLSLNLLIRVRDQNDA